MPAGSAGGNAFRLFKELAQPGASPQYCAPTLAELTGEVAVKLLTDLPSKFLPASDQHHFLHLCRNNTT